MFQREKRYIVFKIKDLPGDTPAAMAISERGINILREMSGKSPLQAMVIEADWPEYEQAWEAIQRRMGGRQTLESELRNQIEKYRWDLEMIRRVASGEDQVADDDTDGMAWISNYINEHQDALPAIDYNENAELRIENAALRDKVATLTVERDEWKEKTHDRYWQQVNKLTALIKEADDYLNTNKLTNIGHGSILHQKMKSALGVPA